MIPTQYSLIDTNGEAPFKATSQRRTVANTEMLADRQFYCKGKFREKEYRFRPDVLVLLQERAESLDMQKVLVPGAPDIAVEVISPSERAVDTQAKLEAYLRYGAREVWQVYPKSKSVVIHRGGAGVVLTLGELITTPLLNGFSPDTNTLFAITM